MEGFWKAEGLWSETRMKRWWPRTNLLRNQDSTSDLDYDAVSRSVSSGRALGASLMAYAAEAYDRADVDWLDSKTALVTFDGRRLLLFGYVRHESVLDDRIASDKLLTKRLLEYADVPTARGYSARTRDAAMSAFQNLKLPVVVKPRYGLKGMGVTVNVSEQADFIRAFERAQAINTDVIIEEQIPIREELRAMAAREEEIGTVAVIRRRLPQVVGDGSRTIRELIEQRNLERDLNPALRWRPIPLDSVTQQVLQRAGFTLETVLVPDQQVIVRNVGGLSSGGELEECLQEVSPSVRNVAHKAIRALPGLRWGGVDVATTDDPRANYIIEINTSAAYGAAEFPSYGPRRMVSGIIWQVLREFATRSTDRRWFTWTQSATKAPSDPIPVDGNALISAHYFSWLKRNGFQIRNLSEHLLEVSSEDNARFWYTKSGRGGGDSLSVARVLSHHSLVLQLLKRARIPLVNHTVVRSESDFLAAAAPTTQYRLTPSRRPWGSPASVRLRKANYGESFLSTGPWVLQEHLQGTRVRVVASPHRAFFQVSRSPVATLPPRLQQRIARLSTATVRAVPGLQWAGVDIVVTDQNNEADARSLILVEGVIGNPRMHRGSEIIAGDLESFFEWLFKLNSSNSDHYPQISLDESPEPALTQAQSSPGPSAVYGAYVPTAKATTPLDCHSNPVHGEPDPRNVYDDPKSRKLMHAQSEQRRNIGCLLIEDAGISAGATSRTIGKRRSILKLDSKRVLVSGHQGPVSPVGAAVTADKLLSKELFESNGVPTPKGVLAADPQAAIEFQQRLGKPIVIKPRYGSQGSGVTVNLLNAQSIHEAFQRAFGRGRPVIAEEFIPIEAEYRCLASSTTTHSVVERVLPTVYGDGKSTIRSLIDARNQARLFVPSTYARMIPIDEVTEATLDSYGITLDTIIPPGAAYVVRNVGGLSNGGDPRECSDSVGQEVKQVAWQAVAAIPGLEWAGVDVAIGQNGVPFVIEVNSSADISGAAFPVFGSPKNVAADIWNMRISNAPDDSAAPALPKFTASTLIANDPISSDDSLPQSPMDSLSNLLRRHLEVSGYALERRGRTVYQVFSPSGESAWLSNCLSVRDSSSAHKAMQNHRVLRTLLKLDNLEVPEIHYFSDRLDLSKELLESTNRYHFWKGSQGWPGADALEPTLLSGQVQEIDLSTIAQQALQGTPIQVVATRSGVLLITSRLNCSNAEIELAASTAVKAVRAVPELRWASVDIKIIGSHTGPVAITEGLTSNPPIGQKSIHHGSIIDVLNYITDSLGFT